MYILLVIWFLFLFVYIAFNIYGVIRVYQMRIPGDATRIAILFYLISIFIIILITLLIIGQLDWSAGVKLF